MSKPASPSIAEDRKFVVALARGLDVLRCYQAADTLLGNGELAQRTGLPKSTISRLTYTLEKHGYLRFDARANKYALDAGVLAIAHAYMAGNDVLRSARHRMRDFAEEIGAAVSIGVRDGLQMMYLDTVRSETALTLGLASGSRLSMLTSSMGRAYLAVLPPDARCALLDSLAAAHRDNHPAARDAVGELRMPLAEALAEARSQVAAFARIGCCYSFGDWHPDVNAVAVPFHDVADQRWLVLSCSGPASSMAPAEFTERVAPRLIELARRLGPTAAPGG